MRHLEERLSVFDCRSKADVIDVSRILCRSILLLVCCLPACMPCFAAQVTTKQKRPNFLFILVDDQSPFDLKAYNSKSPLDSPVLDQLAAEGMVIDGAHHMGAWVGAVCSHCTLVQLGRWLFVRCCFCGDLGAQPCKKAVNC